MQGRVSGIAALAWVVVCACSDPGSPYLGEPDSGQPSVDGPAAAFTPTGERGVAFDHARILVDASRDGGVWWYPQTAQNGGFDPALAHQGMPLASFLKQDGYFVDELMRPSTVTYQLLSGYGIVIRAGGLGTYSDAEVAAYMRYVADGGNLLLLQDHSGNPANAGDRVPPAFGITFSGVTRGANSMDSFTDHPVTSGVTTIRYVVGSAVTSYPAGATILGRLSVTSYVDLDKDNVQDANEPVAPAVLGVMYHGAGRIIFCGDINMWNAVPQPLLGNVLAFFTGG